MSERQREARETKAIAFLSLRSPASALEIGAAAVRGEPWAVGRHLWRAKQEIGLSLAVALARKGIVRATKGNQFAIVRPAA